MKPQRDVRAWLVLALAILLTSLVPAGLAFAGAPGGDDSGFSGIIVKLPASGLVGDWQVGKHTVHVTSATIFEPNSSGIKVGAYVEVKGTPQVDQSFTATKIEVKAEAGSPSHTKFVGIVKSLPASGLIGDWTVQTQMLSQTLTITVHVLATTRIEQEHGTVAVGSQVKVEGLTLPDKSVNAGEIEVVGSPKPGESFEFLGKVEALPVSGLTGDWAVGGRVVHVLASTKIDQEHGKAQVGAIVKVEGTLQGDGSVNAAEVEVRASTTPPPSSNKYIKLNGAVQALPAGGVIGDWTVGGMTIHVSAQTQIERGPAVVGSFVEAKGLMQTDGTINAIKIEVNGMSNSKSPFGQPSAFVSVGK